MAQYNAPVRITGAIKGISRDKLCLEFVLESLADQTQTRKLSFFHTIMLEL